MKLDEEQEKVELEEQQQEGTLEEKPEEASEEATPDERPQEKNADGLDVAESPAGEDEKREEFDSSDEAAWYRDRNRKRSVLETEPWDLPLGRPWKIEKPGHTPQSIKELRLETLVATYADIPWQTRGPKPTEHGQTWRGQRWRPTGYNGAGRWGNSGGKNKQWWAGYYRAKRRGPDAERRYCEAFPKPSLVG